MLGENKNLKDVSKDSVKDTFSMSTNSTKESLPLASSLRDYSTYYIRTNKLITALYMVTDTMDKEEPIRLKLRTLGVEIISDMTSVDKGLASNLEGKIGAILSFLNIAFDIRMISEMNCNILRKEFVELKQSIQEFNTQNNLWFEQFIGSSSVVNPPIGQSRLSVQKGLPIDEKALSFTKGQGTRIGVQKGSTLLKALNKVSHKDNNFELLKQQRRESIIKIISGKPTGVSIKDIVSAFNDLGLNAGEKTLQRELVSMVKDNVLKKTGEKRWSLYFLN